MCGDERAPGHLPLPLWSRLDAIFDEDPFHRVSIRGDAKIMKGIPDPGIASGKVLFVHLEHKIRNPVTQPWPTRSSFSRAVVLLGNQLPKPALERMGGDDVGDLLSNLGVEGPGADCQSPSLVVCKTDPTPLELLLIDPDLLLLILDHLQLLPVDPARHKYDHEA